MNRELLAIFFFVGILLILTYIAKHIAVAIFGVFSTKPSAPYVRTPKRGRDRLVNHLRNIIKPGQIIYDLGAGDGCVLAALFDLEPRATYVGVERSFMPWLIGKLFYSNRRGKNFVWKRGNLFEQDISNADIVVCYLLPHLLTDVYDKAQREMKSGSRLISVGFAVPEVQHFQKVSPEEGDGLYGLSTCLYEYPIIKTLSC